MDGASFYVQFDKKMSFRRRSSKPICWLGTKKTKPNKSDNTKPKWSKLTQKHVKIQSKPLPTKHTNLTLTKHMQSVTSDTPSCGCWLSRQQKNKKRQDSGYECSALDIFYYSIMAISTQHGYYKCQSVLVSTLKNWRIWLLQRSPITTTTTNIEKTTGPVKKFLYQNTSPGNSEIELWVAFVLWKSDVHFDNSQFTAACPLSQTMAGEWFTTTVSVSPQIRPLLTTERIYESHFLSTYFTITTTTTTLFNGFFSRTTWYISRYQKGKTSLDSTEAKDDGVLGRQWHQLDHMQTTCTLFQTDNHINTSSLNFYRPDALPDAQPTMQSIEGIINVTINSSEVYTVDE